MPLTYTPINHGTTAGDGTGDTAFLCFQRANTTTAAIKAILDANESAVAALPTTYIALVTTPTTGNFPQLTAGGGLVNSAYDETSFATAAQGALADTALQSIANNSVGLAQMADVATGTVFYRKTAATGDPEVQTLATLKTDLGLTGTNSGDQTITLTSDVTGSGTGSFATTIANNAVTYAKMQQAAVGYTIMAKATTGAGNYAALTAGSDSVLRRSGTGDLAFGTIVTNNIANSAVTLAKMANVNTSTVFYRKTAAAGAPEVQTLATLKTDLGLTGTNSGDQTITLTGDVTGSGTGSFAATISNSAVTLAKMANVATGTVFYRKTAATGVPEVQTLATLKTDLGLTGTNSGDQTSIAGITGTMSQFDTAVTDGNFAYAGGAFHDGFSDFVANEHIDWTSTASNLNTSGTIQATSTIKSLAEVHAGNTALTTDDQFYLGAVNAAEPKVNWDSTDYVSYDRGSDVWSWVIGSTSYMYLDSTSLSIATPLYVKEQAAAGADVAAWGQLWVKTATPNELWFTNDAGTDYQLTPPSTSGVTYHSKTISIDNVSSAEDITVMFTNVAITISEIRAVVAGTSPSVTWTLRHDTSRSAAGTVIDTNTTTSTTTGDDITTITDATIPADSFIWLETSARSGTVTELSITLFFTDD